VGRGEENAMHRRLGRAMKRLKASQSRLRGAKGPWNSKGKEIRYGRKQRRLEAWEASRSEKKKQGRKKKGSQE